MDLVIEEILHKLKNNEITISSIPEEYSDNPCIVNFEREAGLRVTGKRGFDIISDSFFVEEKFLDPGKTRPTSEKMIRFTRFADYYDYLQGDVYENACYSFHHIPQDELAALNIDSAHLAERTSFIEFSIDDYLSIPTKFDIDDYKTGERIHKHCKWWIEKFNSCSNCSELIYITEKYEKSKLANIIDLTFFFHYYLFAEPDNEKRVSTILDYISTGRYPTVKIVYGLCFVVPPNDVWQAYEKSFNSKSKTTYYRYKERFMEFVKQKEADKIKFHNRGYFDKNSHFYCEETSGLFSDGTQTEVVTYRRYFETFDEFTTYRKGNLANCDLRDAIFLDVDFSKYTRNLLTRLPISINSEDTYSQKAFYREGYFFVFQRWTDANNNVKAEKRHSFKYFFDFVAFLHGDLSNANLLDCSGLENLSHWEGIDFTGAKLRSNMCLKFGMPFDKFEFDIDSYGSVEIIENNEKETALSNLQGNFLQEDRSEGLLPTKPDDRNRDFERIHYIFDLHLLHRMKNENCVSKLDVDFIINKIANTICSEVESLLLIGGDVSASFSLFQLFVKRLSETLHRKEHKWKHTTVVFVLGNHEFWEFPRLSVDSIVEKYRALLCEYGMILLHNDILYKEDPSDNNEREEYHRISYKELVGLTDKQILERLRYARFVILGGVGFAGYDEKFNAEIGLYRKTIDRPTEIIETLKFENLYARLLPVFEKRNTLVLTHMPQKNWCKNPDPAENIVYVNGHTHKNYFYDDGAIRVYSDNQIGYRGKSIGLKYLLLNNEYDLFDDYSDGIYEITREQYIDFQRGKNISMTFRRPIHKLYMLKRNGYYCFLHEAKNGTICILNGGSYKQTNAASVQYCYEKMDSMIALIKSPLEKYSAIQGPIASAIAKLGGSGRIHGCIIDIDFWNHIYVNPIDGKVTGYSASDIVNKTVFPTIPALLKAKCPDLYLNYSRLLSRDQNTMLTILQPSEIANKPASYLDTDIYRASREIRKMQKLSSHILTTWYQDALQERQVIEIDAPPDKA